VYEVRSETYRNVIEIAGSIAAAKEQTLQAAGDGTVMAVYVNEGDTVEKGQLILQIDDTEQRYNLARHDYDMEQKRLTGAPREIALMQQQRGVLLQRLRDRRITASFDGVMAQFSVSSGDYLEAKDTAGVLINRSYLMATVEIVETDAPKLKAGQPVTLMFPANGNTPIEGYVYSFPAVGTKTTRGAAVVKAEIRLDNPPDIILPNYSFTGEIEISPPITLTLVERLAIDREKGQTFAERFLPSGGTERIEVEVEPYGPQYVKVTSGLNPGDRVKQLSEPRVSGQNRQGMGGTTRQGQTRGPQNAMPAVPMMPR
jgi:multidrug efflux pump subunit AcrA (membrane-fusion protein)